MNQDEFRSLIASKAANPEAPKRSSGGAGPAANEPAPRSAKKQKQVSKWKKRQQEKDEAGEYRDRAEERRRGLGGADEAGAVEGADAEALAAAVADETTSKFLGGERQTTHLVKGLDFALLEREKAKLASSAPSAGRDPAGARAATSDAPNFDSLPLTAAALASTAGSGAARDDAPAAEADGYLPEPTAFGLRVLRAAGIAHPLHAAEDAKPIQPNATHAGGRVAYRLPVGLPFWPVEDASIVMRTADAVDASGLGGGGDNADRGGAWRGVERLLIAKIGRFLRGEKEEPPPAPAPAAKPAAAEPAPAPAAPGAGGNADADGSGGGGGGDDGDGSSSESDIFADAGPSYTLADALRDADGRPAAGGDAKKLFKDGGAEGGAGNASGAGSGGKGESHLAAVNRLVQEAGVVVKPRAPAPAASAAAAASAPASAPAPAGGDGGDDSLDDVLDVDQDKVAQLLATRGSAYDEAIDYGDTAAALAVAERKREEASDKKDRRKRKRAGLGADGSDDEGGAPGQRDEKQERKKLTKELKAIDKLMASKHPEKTKLAQ